MRSTNALLTAAAVCFLVALAVPTVAITVGEDPATDDVVLEPADDRYASIENGELELDLDILTNAETTILEVFTITIGDEADDIEAIWVDHDVEGITFYSDGDPVTNNSRLEPSAGETITVGVTADGAVAESGTETFTIHVEYEAEDDLEQPKMVSLWDLEVEPRSVDTGDSVQVNATYRNNDDTTKTVTSALTVDGTVVDTQEFDLRAGERKTVTFERQMQWPGTFDVGVDGTDSERVTVTGPPIEVLESSIGSSDGAAGVSATEINTGDTISVNATVRNPTDTAVDRTLELSVNGIVVDTRTVTIGPHSEVTVTFERQFDEAGEYDIGVSGVSAGTITVSEPSFEIRDRELSAATTAALAPPMAMGLLFLGVAANRRWPVVPLR